MPVKKWKKCNVVGAITKVDDINTNAANVVNIVLQGITQKHEIQKSRQVSKANDGSGEVALDDDAATDAGLIYDDMEQEDASLYEEEDAQMHLKMNKMMMAILSLKPNQIPTLMPSPKRMIMMP